MRRSAWIFVTMILGFGIPGFPQGDPATVLWFTGPAEKWEDALPVGNGRLGGMLFGGVREERLQFNEETYWTGGPYSTVVRGAYQRLPEIRRLLFEGRTIEAHLAFDTDGGQCLLSGPAWRFSRIRAALKQQGEEPPFRNSKIPTGS